VSQIAYVSQDEQLGELFRTAALRAARMTESEAKAIGRGGAAPAVLVVDVRPHHDLPQWLIEVQRRQPSLGVVLIVAVLDARFVLDAMRAGVRECLQEPLSAQAIGEALRRLIVGETLERSGTVVAVVGAKGGVGTTTVAVNTAAHVARVTSSAPLLVDLHVTRGDVAVFMGTEPRFSVLDALENLHKVDESFLAGLVEKAPSKVHVLASSTRQTPMAVPATALKTLLDLAARRYRFTVVDVPRADLAALDALDCATSIVLVTSQELSSVRAAAATAGMLRQRYGAKRLRVVINRFDKSGSVTSQDVARVVGEPIAALIPSDYRAAVEAINVGRPIVLDEGRLSKALRQLAGDITNLGKPAPKPRGVLGRLAWRKA
jgi:pilus assembly protein CpaE